MLTDAYGRDHRGAHGSRGHLVPGITYGRAIAMIEGLRARRHCFTNDPYSGYLATHVPDLHLWKPVFDEGGIVCFVCGHIHNTDMGGAVPASLSRALTEVHQEGIRFPPMKLYASAACSTRSCAGSCC